QAVELRRVEKPPGGPLPAPFWKEGTRDIPPPQTVTHESEGWGEGSAPGGPPYPPGNVDGCDPVPPEPPLPRPLRAPERDPARVAEILRPVQGHRMAKAAIEMAVLDAELRARREPLVRHLGGVFDAVECGVSVGIQDGIDQLLEAVEAYLADGYRRVKLKIEPGWDVEPVRAVRARFHDVPLQVDANAAYTLADARHLARLDEFDLLLIEQPLPAEQVRAHAELASQLATP